MALFCLLMLFPFVGQSFANKPSEYELKAVFIFNFTKFINWPPASFSPEDANYQICMYGSEVIQQQMSRLDGRVSGGRVLQFHRLDNSTTRRYCHVLFIAYTSPDEIENLLRTHSVNPTLIIGEQAGFAQQYGGIEFEFDERQRIKLQINLQDIQSRNLQISAQLLEIAVKVHGREQMR